MSVYKRGCNVVIIFCILAEICHALSGQIDHVRDTQKRQYLNNAKVNCTFIYKVIRKTYGKLLDLVPPMSAILRVQRNLSRSRGPFY